MLPYIPLHFLCTHLRQLVHCIELLPTPLPHTPHQRKLASKRAHHTMHYPCIHGLAAQTGVWMKATETEISAALWTLWLQKDLNVSFTTKQCLVTETQKCEQYCKAVLQICDLFTASPVTCHCANMSSEVTQYRLCYHPHSIININFIITSYRYVC